MSNQNFNCPFSLANLLTLSPDPFTKQCHKYTKGTKLKNQRTRAISLSYGRMVPYGFIKCKGGPFQQGHN